MFFDEFGKRIQPSFKNTSMIIQTSAPKDLLLILYIFFTNHEIEWFIPSRQKTNCWKTTIIFTNRKIE